MTLSYGFCIGPSGKYDQIAKPALEGISPSARVYERRDQASIFEAYNSIIEECIAEGRGDNGLILMHEDVQLLGDISAAIESQFEDPDVAIVGAIGGRGVNSVRWVRSDHRFGHAPDTFYGANHYSDGTHDVDIVDGLLLALSPWAIQNLRFDSATYSGFHAYDADICMEARQSGKLVRVTNLPLIHHTKGGFGDVRIHREIDDAFRRKWSIPLDSPVYRARKRIRNGVY